MSRNAIISNTYPRKEEKKGARFGRSEVITHIQIASHYDNGVAYKSGKKGAE